MDRFGGHSHLPKASKSASMLYTPDTYCFGVASNHVSLASASTHTSRWVLSEMTPNLPQSWVSSLKGRRRNISRTSNPNSRLSDEHESVDGTSNHPCLSSKGDLKLKEEEKFIQLPPVPSSKADREFVR